MDSLSDELQKAKAAQRLQATEKKISEIDSRIDKVKNKKSLDKQIGWDWSNSYQNWNNYEDLEDLYSQKDNENNKLKKLIANSTADNLGHYHDHSNEKNFFESSEEYKFQLCERNRLVGNYLFKEGLIEKALEHYKIAITYYEYCFPEDEEKQKKLDTIRHTCLCNSSLCHLKLGNYRIAIENANLVLSETNNNNEKALFRRAQAYRFIDEYSLALDDLKCLLHSNPNDKLVQEEINIIKILKQSYEARSKSFAQTSLLKDNNNNNNNNKVDNNSNNNTNNSNTNNNTTENWKFPILNEYIPIEPIMPTNLIKLENFLWS